MVLASRLIMAAGVIQALALVVWVVAMTTQSGQDVIRPLVEQAIASNPQAAAGISVQTMVNLVGGMLAVVQLASTIIYFWMAAAVRKGKRWARTMSLVLAIVSIVLVPEGASYSYYTAARIVVGLVAVLLLFRGPAKQ
ncbi:hypothetical protein AL755_19900 [Arthrobacter sp. ERGS1:01]|uniref:hypothetical protein n=1 Tax=Arthrobacter sp. ERGS1:01 TaxID=1704044 RepID=UPI0006B4CD28|nr:hypothetical protein [Arthrobacter sp. ERGS1:01]ALE07216.1 hypothetical protein AL755_19900 [Arthrobacter sp. ERGS1:01]